MRNLSIEEDFLWGRKEGMRYKKGVLSTPFLFSHLYNCRNSLVSKLLVYLCHRNLM